MAANLIIKYDPTGDILYINKCAPYTEQESEELGDDIIVRVNPKTEEIENLEILFFSQRLQENNELQLPLIAKYRYNPSQRHEANLGILLQNYH